MRSSTRAVLTLVLALAGTSAGGAEDIGAAVRACRQEPDDGKRLACYDGAVDGSRAVAGSPRTTAPAQAPAPAQTPAPAAPPAPAQTAEENFGREHRIEYERQERQHEEARALGSIEATVTNIETRIDGLMTFTLDNGQVWRQNSVDSRFRLKEGDAVKIQAGALRSFILSGPGKRSTRVTRIK